MARHILITGCSGAGKSTLIAALAAAGQATVPEPGRRILAEERARGGSALPWTDARAFAARAAAMAARDIAEHAHLEGAVFHDRGLVDAAAALLHLSGTPLRTTLGGPSPYADPVFLAPPWPEIYVTDADRRHGADAALAEYFRIRKALETLGHATRVLPRAPVAARVAFVLAALG